MRINIYRHESSRRVAASIDIKNKNITKMIRGFVYFMMMRLDSFIEHNTMEWAFHKHLPPTTHNSVHNQKIVEPLADRRLDVV